MKATCICPHCRQEFDFELHLKAVVSNARIPTDETTEAIITRLSTVMDRMLPNHQDFVRNMDKKVKAREEITRAQLKFINNLYRNHYENSENTNNRTLQKADPGQEIRFDTGSQGSTGKFQE